jgi:hypothetical protein
LRFVVMTNTFFVAPPREGKTYIVVTKAVDKLLHGKKVYSNFPIIFWHKHKLYQSRVWKREMFRENITDALIIIDEAQAWYDSVDVKTLPPDEDAFYATTGQNNLEVMLISQGVTRVTKAIRDRVNVWCRVRLALDVIFLRNREGKFGRPLLFTATYYDRMEDLGKENEEVVLFKERIWFHAWIAAAYNTHFFRNTGEPFTPPLWTDELHKTRGIPHERFKEHADKAGLESISTITDGGVISSPGTGKVPDTDISPRAGGITSRCKAKIAEIAGRIKRKIPDRILPGSHGRGERERSSPGVCGGLPPSAGSPEDLGSADRSTYGQPYPDGHTVCQEVQNILPGDDQADENQSLLHESRLAVARCIPGLEEDNQGIYTLEQLYEDLGVQQRNSSQEVAGTREKE